ncbi:RusA family crossover junction endodeoxyribonuclease [uncultured Leptotrichia sp.]|uniref:RusA family crossover junction endodeoxyribonuclease n=1 Tax=uncultured Leptotrichia sp. TaxID=159271 RepID=UPI0025F734EE|nr:RusA family crossover junction endodeoxyribonuclease [uncultured Leptotrichia sp.]
MWESRESERKMSLEKKILEIQQNLLNIEKELKKMNEESVEKQKYLYAFSLKGTLRSMNFFMKLDNLKKEYDKYTEKIRKIIKREYGEVELLERPLKVKIIYFFDEYEFMTKDVDNYYKVLIDSLKKTLIIDDKFIEELVILKKRTNKLYSYISVYIEDYNAEEIYYIPEKIGEMPELVIEKMEILEDKNILGAEDLNLEANNSKSELTKEKTQKSLGSNEYFKELKQKYDQTCSKLKVPNNRYSALKNVFLIELEKIKDNKEMFEENFLKFIEETPKFVNTDLFVTKYSGRSKQFNIKNFNRKRANNFLRTGFGYAFDKSYNFKKV